MTGVGAAIVAYDDVKLGAEDINDFPLGFIAPLQSDDTRSGHSFSFVFLTYAS